MMYCHGRELLLANVRLDVGVRPRPVTSTTGKYVSSARTALARTAITVSRQAIASRAHRACHRACEPALPRPQP